MLLMVQFIANNQYLIILCTLIVFGGCLSLVVYPKYRLKKGSVKYGKVN